MHNRWFHRPHLHSPAPGNTRRVDWLELFYDLIYVAAIIQLGTALSENPGFEGFLIYAALFVPMWTSWTSFTFYANRFIVDDLVHRLMIFGQMFGIGAMAVCVGDVFEGDTMGFAAAYSVVRWLLAGLYVRTWLAGEGGRELARRNAFGFGLGAVLWTISIFLPSPWVYLCWGLALNIDFLVPLNRRSRALSLKHPPDVLHMSERYGLLTIIVLGESFVKVLSEGAIVGMNAHFAIMGGLALLVTFSLWWIYFDDVAGSRIKKGELTPFVWVYSHLPLTLAITAVGVSIKKAALMDPGLPPPEKYGWLLCGTLAAVLLSVAALDHVTERRVSNVGDRHRVVTRLGSAIAVLLLAAVGGFMSAALFVSLVTVIMLAQVFIDLAMAPMADPHEAHHEHPRLFGDDDEDEDDAIDVAESTRSRTRDPANFVRRGAPSELRADLYFHLMEGTWRQLFAIVVIGYLFINVLFGGLYLLDPTGIRGMPDPSFTDAFFFSLQTISTIGYGVMAPESLYANTLVTIEAMIGVLCVALITGLVFAKAARPRSSTLFSRPICVRQYDGKPTLMFRVGNARGNEVVEASMKIVAILEETTAEGTSMRRLYDMELVRDNSPLFVLSWTAMHVLDEESPLWGLSPEDLERDLVAMTVTLTGHDATYGQTTHARYLYHPADIRWGHRFVDVIEPLADGQLSIDYAKFHRTRPDPTVVPELPYCTISMDDVAAQAEKADGDADGADDGHGGAH